MWHLMWLTLSFVLCFLSTVNYVAAAPIDSADEAARYLERFGYLERGPQDSYSQSVSAEYFMQLFDAIKDFQSFAGLKKTGELDKETLEVMNKPRCGIPDRIRPGHSSTRRKRFAIQGSHWPKKKLTYKIKKYTTDMSQSDVDREIARAFQVWADVTDLAFVHVKNPSADVDIDILFASGEHGNCPSFNGGPGFVYAHAAYPINGGDAHFDEGETWALDSVKAGTNLFQVATHEFGHSLGLEHTDVPTAVMYPFHGYSSDFKLDKDDIEGIQELYGKNQFSRKLALELKATLELLKTTVNNLEKKNIELRNDLIDTRTNLNKKLEETKQELVKTRAYFTITVDDLSAKLNVQTSEIVDIGKMPTSCADLQQIGHKLSGFFSVKGSKKMEMIYCNFNANQNDKQKWIGYADVKSAPVHFHVQRNSSFETQLTPIPFELARVNEGNAMNLSSGIFTAPRPGIYFFSFTGVAHLFSSSSYAWFSSYLFLNGNRIGMSNVQEHKGPVRQYSPLTLQSTLNLKKGDRVWVTIETLRFSSLYDDKYDDRGHLTHFTGFMLEEEIVAYL
ncbi:uncharacterized protein LOC124316198 isoform X2 [Daphnia pulicaria]|uniref:uncharacterized protein LOC124316198 isoform X2 n=1 Tax=Daphnia pulicaria TaxID=35523 RepID=UPI001EEA5A0F|nr:uncharacterized protein LOC124316198 isoform X2 [Daphnia pulicaria]